jgi:hypothetical protein
VYDDYIVFNNGEQVFAEKDNQNQEYNSCMNGDEYGGSHNPYFGEKTAFEQPV